MSEDANGIQWASHPKALIQPRGIMQSWQGLLSVIHGLDEWWHVLEGDQAHDRDPKWPQEPHVLQTSQDLNARKHAGPLWLARLLPSSPQAWVALHEPGFLLKLNYILLLIFFHRLSISINIFLFLCTLLNLNGFLLYFILRFSSIFNLIFNCIFIYFCFDLFFVYSNSIFNLICPISRFYLFIRLIKIYLL